ncbi:MAG: HAMP domain-containing sensor histidine kinase [Gemmatimonadota bacterium]
MSFRARLLFAFGLSILIPLVVFALGIRREMRERLTAQYERRVASLVSVIQDDLLQESEEIASRLTTLKTAIADDNRLRSALGGSASERAYLLNYAGRAMRLAGLSMLQIQDAAGRILSSGHFRNEFDRLEPELPGALAESPDGLALVRARSPRGPFLALARADSFRLGGRRFTVVGGVALERRFLAGLERDDELVVSLLYPGGALSSSPELEQSLNAVAGAAAAAQPQALELDPRFSDLVVGELAVPYVGGEKVGEGSARGTSTARILVTHPLTPLVALRRSIDVWFLLALAVTGVIALLAATWIASRISRPITELARKTSQLDLDRLDVDFASERKDEVGALSRLLGAMTERLRSSAVRLREAERLATLGDVARQINHDIKNGLTPIRNVFRHFAQVARDEPDKLSAVFVERQGTVDSSISYLETLASNYARLSPRLERRRCDVNAAVREVMRSAGGDARVALQERLAPSLPAVVGDEVALRRILENLVGNAIDSLGAQHGTVSVSTESLDGEREGPAVRITVADTGPGMTEEQLERIFDDFYTTKEGGTGLGLSIVRRLVLDLNGTLRVDSKPGAGTRFIVELPAADARSTAEAMRSGDGGGAER